ncbi:UNKNOWN [Stylonychia lemnae]|uniref:Uncharacterized protein n=1 Tax=Stylonychia lemnae TaxID=5949 RepID=A0A078BBH3_STYLE|nr:UNKNOWN [Stylonychia lemnae]|eukprot:CDW90617.1 UNKNOWN [Stylonychia lemnae]
MEKIVAEIHLKYLQTFNHVMDVYVQLMNERINTNILSSLWTCKWNNHRENTTSASWLIADQENNSKQKMIVLLPSPGLLGLIRTFRQIITESKQIDIAGDFGNKFLIEIICDSLQSTLSQYIAIVPSRGRNRQYLYDLIFLRYLITKSNSFMEACLINHMISQINGQKFSGINQDMLNILNKLLMIQAFETFLSNTIYLLTTDFKNLEAIINDPFYQDKQGELDIQNQSQIFIRLLNLNESMQTTENQQKQPYKKREDDFIAINAMTGGINQSLQCLFQFIRDCFNKQDVVKSNFFKAMMNQQGLNGPSNQQAIRNPFKNNLQNNNEDADADDVEEIELGQQSSRETFQVEEMMSITFSSDFNQWQQLLKFNQQQLQETQQNIDKKIVDYNQFLSEYSNFGPMVKQALQDQVKENPTNQSEKSLLKQFKYLPLIVDKDGFGPCFLNDYTKMRIKGFDRGYMSLKTVLFCLAKRFDICKCQEDFPKLNDEQEQQKNQILYLINEI